MSKLCFLAEKNITLALANFLEFGILLYGTRNNNDGAIFGFPGQRSKLERLLFSVRNDKDLTFPRTHLVISRLDMIDMRVFKDKRNGESLEGRCKMQLDKRAVLCCF